MICNDVWRDAKWLRDHRSLTQYQLYQMVEAGEIRSKKGGKTKQSRRVFCLDDIDAVLKKQGEKNENTIS